MNNEEKILSALEQIVDRLDKLEQGQTETTAQLRKMQGDIETMQGNIETMQGNIETMQEDIEIIKEDGAVTRAATNALVEWAEQAEVEVRIPFMRKAE